jgi:uncharacterized protein (TIGR03066 family)
MRTAAAILLALCAPAALAAPIPKERAEAEKIVGTWKMTLSAQGEADVNLELDFYPGGKMVIRQVLRNGAGASVYEGTYRVVGRELPYDVKQGTAAKKETLTIKKLTDTELIVVDPDGLKEEFVRVRKDPSKKDGK